MTIYTKQNPLKGRSGLVDRREQLEFTQTIEGWDDVVQLAIVRTNGRFYIRPVVKPASLQSNVKELNKKL